MSTTLSILRSESFDANTYCYKCGVVVVMPEVYKKKRIEDHETWFCLNGHRQYFTGKTEAQKLQERLEAKQRELDSEVARRVRTEKSVIALKGQVTRTKNRVAAGVCPCCNRSFVGLGRHMATKHPDWKGQDIG